MKKNKKRLLNMNEHGLLLFYFLDARRKTDPKHVWFLTTMLELTDVKSFYPECSRSNAYI